MTFHVTADAYARFMGRFSEPLAATFIDLLDPQPGQRALDVGCGPGIVTTHLVQRLGVDAVSAIDPSPSFVEAVQAQLPGIDARAGVAEHLPYADGTFDLTIAQLVVHFMRDPVGGLSEMARVTRSGGVVAASVWDHSTAGRGPLSTFWQAVQDLDPEAPDESRLPGAREGHLAMLAEEAGLTEVEPSLLTVNVGFRSFEEWWQPFTLGVGPAGAYVGALDEAHIAALRARCEQLLPPAPFELAASAWCVRARA